MNLNENPFKPGAGHPPPYLAGRESAIQEFHQLLRQTAILENVVLTGLRGVGKTVLLDRFRTLAIQDGWIWVGTDLSESSSVNETSMAIRLITDLAVVTSSIQLYGEERPGLGFNTSQQPVTSLNYDYLLHVFESTPGLNVDKLKAVLVTVDHYLRPYGKKGIIFAYDEAQSISNHPKKEQYPLSMILDLFQSIQKRGAPFMLVLTGLPTLFPNLVDARTFSERMFRIIFLEHLSQAESAEAVLKPLENQPFQFTQESLATVIEKSGGYPYFIQFICKEAYDIFQQDLFAEGEITVPIEEITRKLDRDFFSGRWARVTDRQRELLMVIASLESKDDEFSVQEIVKRSKEMLEKQFSRSHVSQMLGALIKSGLIYKNRHGKYSFAVPMLGRFILRQMEEGGR